MNKLKQVLLTIIDTIGKKLGINARYFTYQGLFTLQAHSINILYGLTVSYVTTLLFSQELYGQYRFVLTIIGILGILKLGSVSTAIAKDVSQHKTSPLIYTLKIYCIPAVLFGVSLLASIPMLYIWNRGELWPLFLMAAALGPIEGVILTFSGGLITGKALFKTAIYYSISAKILSIILIGGMFIFYPSASLLIGITMGVNILVYGMFVKKYLYRFTNTDLNNRIMLYGAKLSLINVPGTVIWYIDNLMITAYFGLTQLAIFSIALMIPEQVKMLFKELFMIVFSKQASGKDSMQRRKQLIYFSFLGTIGFLGIILLYWITADYYFGIIFPKYNNSHTILLSKIAFASLITIPWNLVPQYLEAHGATKAVRNSNLISSGILLICLIILIPQFNLIGAIISRAIFRVSYVLTSVYYLYTSKEFIAQT